MGQPEDAHRPEPAPEATFSEARHTESEPHREIEVAAHAETADYSRLTALEARLEVREAQLAEAERTIVAATGELSRRARKKVLDGRGALADAQARLEREVARATELEAEVGRQITLREAAHAEAEQRLIRYKARAEREKAAASAAGKREAGSARAALERTRAAASAEMDRVQAGFEQRKRELEVALRSARAATEEARCALARNARRAPALEERLAAAIDGEAEATRESTTRRQELEATQAELARLRDERGEAVSPRWPQQEESARDAEARRPGDERPAARPTPGHRRGPARGDPVLGGHRPARDRTAFA